MSLHVEQFKHNERFHSTICQSSPDDYFDWKITCLFYSSLHLLHGLAEKRKISLGNTHHDTLCSLKARHRDCKMPIKFDAFEAYHTLYRYCMDCRYDGFEDIELFNESKKADYKDALKKFEYIKRYVIGQGLEVYKSAV